MIQPLKKKKYPALEDEPFVIPDLSQMGNITALAGGSGRPVPTDATSGSADNVVQFPPLAPPQGSPPVNNPIPADEPVNMGYGRTMYPSLAAETPFQAQAVEPQAAPVKQLSPLEQAQGGYEKAVAEPAHKQGKAAQIANFALQFIADAFTPGEHQYEWLGNQKKQNRVDAAVRTLAPLQAQETYKEKIATGRAQRENLIEDNRRSEDSRRDLAEYRKGTLAEREAARISRQQDTKMRTVAGMLSKTENYDPTDPRFAEVTKALGDVGLPIAPKDSKKKIDLVQDKDTGAWTVVLTDPYSKQQEVRPVVNKDGSQLVTTSGEKVAGEYAAGRQTAGFAHDEKMKRLSDNLSREMKAYEDELSKAKEERDETRKKAVEARVEAARKRVAKYADALRNGDDPDEISFGASGGVIQP